MRLPLTSRGLSMNHVQNGGVQVALFEFAGAASVPVGASLTCCLDVSGLRVRKKTTTIAFIPKPHLSPGPIVN